MIKPAIKSKKAVDISHIAIIILVIVCLFIAVMVVTGWGRNAGSLLDIFIRGGG